jgi:hypothetical protein
MVVGAPTNSADTTPFHWQLYELTNLDSVIANTNTTPAFAKVSNQPTNANNVTPCYATDGRIIFMSDMPYNGFNALDEYKGWPTITGTYSLEPATADLKMIEHTPRGAFNPFIDSFGRLIVTRWDHLSQDPLAVDDRLAVANGGISTNGSFNFLFETPNSPAQATNIGETFPEPRNTDTAAKAALGVNGNTFNFFFPWALDEDGGNEEFLNHAGRHEMQTSGMLQSFVGDTNLFSFTNLASRIASGVSAANTNGIGALIQIVEDPRTNGLYWGVQAQDISIFGGSHSAGQILTLTGGSNVNPTNMVVNNITAPQTASPVNAGALGLFRNPLPMSDGKLIAAWTPRASTSSTFGFDTNIGTATFPISQYSFRLMTLTNTNPYWTTNQFITAGISNTFIYYEGALLVTNSAFQWELQPVEVRAKSIPAPVRSGVSSIEQQVFVAEGVDLQTFQADLAKRNLALCISRNVTARDAADKQQPYNLQVPGGVSSIANSGKTYDITHLTFLQADYLRGYSNGPAGIQPGRRILAAPMHATTNLNYVSSQTNAPVGGTELMSDGSQATIIPASRAVTWHLTGVTNDSVVKERYWISFRPGEVRTCANCHGINAVDQLGRTSPTNSPLALHKLLQLWRTNSANAYSLTVSNGLGGGNYGAGSIVSLTANPAPSGQSFAGWTGASVVSPGSPATSFIMPINDVTVAALYTNLPSPIISSSIVSITNTLELGASASANQPWVLEGSPDLIAWVPLSTNLTSGSGLLQLSVPITSSPPQQFFRLRSP